MWPFVCVARPLGTRAPVGLLMAALIGACGPEPEPPVSEQERALVSIEYSTDRPGGDYSNFNLPEARSELCLAACARSSSCRAYTYVNPGVQGPSARCWLKSSVPATVANGCCTSGVRREMEVNTDRPGMDYRNFNLAAASVWLCRSACAQDYRCAAYTYVRPGVQGASARCWLKSAAPAAVSNTCCTSDVKRAMESRIDRPGRDYRSFDLTAANPRLCQATCATEAACQAFTYVAPGVQGPSARCWLKSTVPPAVSNSQTVSGIKGQEF